MVCLLSFHSHDHLKRDFDCNEKNFSQLEFRAIAEQKNVPKALSVNQMEQNKTKQT